MTTEEKAKAYDRAVEIINGTSTDKYGCIIGIKPTDIFPELAESEYERIRKRLITLVNDTFDDNNFGYLTKREDYNNMIAWLEKQGEQKSVEWSKEMGSLVLDAIGLIRDYGEDVPKDSQLGQKIARADAFLSDLYHESFYPSTFNLRNDLKPIK